jgi:hypothetical protein
MVEISSAVHSDNFRLHMLNKNAVNFTRLVQKRDRWWIRVHVHANNTILFSSDDGVRITDKTTHIFLDFVHRPIF